MADAYTDACHAMRRWKTAIKTLVSGFSLPVASFSYPARKKSLILRLLSSSNPEAINPPDSIDLGLNNRGAFSVQLFQFLLRWVEVINCCFSDSK